MVDPVIRDLNRHLDSIDVDEGIREHAELLVECDPDTYEDMSEDELYRYAKQDLKDRAEDAAVEAYIEQQQFEARDHYDNRY